MNNTEARTFTHFHDYEDIDPKQSFVVMGHLTVEKMISS